ncbi:olfactory receptor 8K3-like [Trichosurus vulpecula]|uniref:olfactory receptor 8K3-like n=1 Tax=Trichosurus vulpecula TaxID=9337 RepID=UPI00186B0EEC|nr:olfactory receptor 8K3-like [Trichosurus vulpecula]
MIKINDTKGNQVTEFVLMGITSHVKLQGTLFALFFLNYMVTALGNLGLIILTCVDSHLQTPMYFFLRNLAFVDLGYSTVVGPKMLVSFMVEKNNISFNGCAIQLVFFGIFMTSEVFVLSAMAYDHYVAICKPLVYMVIMSDRVCYILVVVPYIYSIIVSLLVTVKIFNLSFCDSNVIQHFYCDSLPLLSIVCSDTSEIELILMSLCSFNLVYSLLIILVSYVLILVAILRMNSTEGRHKAFSTCGSHLTVVVVFYATLLFMYLQPQSSHSFDIDKMASVFYTLIIPMLNPLIYSLRNNEVKGALKRVFKKLMQAFSQCPM